jgi:uncharacterized membrane protein YdbT with pleckstrin-like domain
MGYIEQNLIDGESVVYHARLHWILFLKPALVSLALIAIAVVFFIFSKDSAVETGVMMRRFGIALIVLSIIPIVVGALRRSAREYVVTSKRVVMQLGAVKRKTDELFLNKIESVGVDQSVTGRMLGYGTVTIRGTGGTFDPFERVSAPLELRRQIQEQIARSFGGNIPTVKTDSPTIPETGTRS